MRPLDLLRAVTAVLISQGCVADSAETATFAPAMASTSSTSTTADDGSTSVADEPSPTETSGPDCVIDVDCGEGFVCEDGACVDLCVEYLESGADARPRQSPVEVWIERRDVVFVVDKSGSMSTAPFDDDGDLGTPPVTRWAGLHAALREFLLDNEALNPGLALFPSRDALAEYSEKSCLMEPVLEVSVNDGHSDLLLEVMPPAMASSAEVAGSTPTRAAIESARADLEAGGSDDKAIVLLTDGAANCTPGAVDPAMLMEVYDEGVVDAVAGAYAAGIPTYVVGLDVSAEPSPTEQDGIPDGVDLHAALRDLAIAGGTAKDDPDAPFANVKDGPALATALAELAPLLIPCEVSLSSSFLELDLSMSISGAPYSQIPAEECASADGWSRGGDVDDEGWETMLLCGQACLDLRRGGTITFYPPGPCD